MIRNFITTIEILPENITSKIDTCILETLQKKYNLKCFEEYFIKSVNKINKRSTLYCPRNEFSGIYLCDVDFAAECLVFNEGDLLATTVTDLDRESVLCETAEYSLCLKYDPQIKLKIGSKIIVIIKKVTYEIGNIVAINAFIYKPPFKTQVIAILDIEEEIPGYNLCMKRLEELQSILAKNEIAQKVMKLLQFNKKSKMIFSSYSLFSKSSLQQENTDEKSLIPEVEKTGKPIYIILNPLDTIEYYRIAPFGTSESMLSVDCPFVIRTEGCSISAMKLKLATSLCNYLETILNLIKTEEEFEDNQIIWDFYIKNGNK